MEHSRQHPSEMLYARRARLLSEMYTRVDMLFELEKNLSNPDGMAESAVKELEESREDIHSELHTAWLQLEHLDRENNE